MDEEHLSKSIPFATRLVLGSIPVPESPFVVGFSTVAAHAAMGFHVSIASAITGQILGVDHGISAVQ
jgi:hypothetical protein